MGNNNYIRKWNKIKKFAVTYGTYIKMFKFFIFSVPLVLQVEKKKKKRCICVWAGQVDSEVD